MKQIVLLVLIISTAFFLNSCKKNSAPINDTYAIILGKWDIINDSTFVGIGISNHALNYIGQAGDYFDFRTDSIIYTKEGSVLDTLSYRLTSNNTIIISSFGIIINGMPDTSHITNLTGHSLMITAPDIITPAGIFGRKVSLSR